MQKCSRCSASVHEGVSFCPNCGNALSGIPAPLIPRNPLSPSVPMAYGGQAETSGKATASLILGILAYIILPFLAAIPAIVLGHVALSDIKKSAGRLKGNGMATAGMVMGYAQIVLIPFILIIAAIAIPNLLRAKMASNEASAIGALRPYSFALGTYASMCPKIGFPASLANLGPGSHDCQRAQLLDGFLGTANPRRSGYEFHYEAGAADGPGQVTSFTLSAEPITENTTGTRHFFVDETGVIRVNRDGQATANSPPIQ